MPKINPTDVNDKPSWQQWALQSTAITSDDIIAAGGKTAREIRNELIEGVKEAVSYERVMGVYWMLVGAGASLASLVLFLVIGPILSYALKDKMLVTPIYSGLMLFPLIIMLVAVSCGYSGFQRYVKSRVAPRWVVADKAKGLWNSPGTELGEEDK